MELRAIYRKHRELNGDLTPAKYALASAKNAVAQHWAEALRGWQWDCIGTHALTLDGTVVHNGVEYEVWSEVNYDMDTSADDEYGVRVRGDARRECEGIGRNGHLENRAVVDVSGQGRVDLRWISFEGWADNAAYYRKLGCSKQVAYEKSAACFRRQVEAFEERAYESYVVTVELRTLDHDVVATMSIGGVTCGSDSDELQYLGQAQEDCLRECLSQIDK